jgi:hypothetical protein
MKLSPHTCFQDRRLKPLGHPSAGGRVKFYHRMITANVCELRIEKNHAESKLA